MGTAASLVILVFALTAVVKTLGVVARALAEAIAALVRAMLTLLAVAGLILVLIAAQIGGCAQDLPEGELRIASPVALPGGR